MFKKCIVFIFIFASEIVFGQANQFAYMRIQVRDSNGDYPLGNVTVKLLKNDTSFILSTTETQIKLTKFLSDTIVAIHPALGTTKLHFNAKYGALKELRILLPKSCSTLTRSNVCPLCNRADEVISIVYGKSADRKMKKEEKKGKIKLGEGVENNCSPIFFCKRNNKEF
jgi:hypothetical protein